MSSRPEENAEVSPETSARGDEQVRTLQDASVGGQPTPTFAGEPSVVLDWKDGILVGLRIGGALTGLAEDAAVDTRYVFRVRGNRDKLILTADPSASIAWVETSERGAPTRIKLQDGRANDPGSPEPRSNTVIKLGWQEGTLVGVSVEGDFPSRAGSQAPLDRRRFKIQRQNEAAHEAEARDKTRELVPQGPQKTDRALAKAVHAVEKAIEALDGSIHREFAGLEQSLRQSIVDTASGVVGAVWHAQRGDRRVNAALPLVLISQVHRSGGTLLARLFDGHPEVLAFPQELRWGGDHKYRWPEVDPTAEGPLRIAHRLAATNFEEAKTNNLFGYEKVQGVDGGLRLPFQWSRWGYVEAFLQAWEAERPQTRRECLDIFMTAYFSAFLDWRGRSEPKKFVTAFTTRMNFIRSYPGNEAFFDDYPDGLMISICRHPADWYASATHVLNKFATTDEAMTLWRESTECSLQLKERHPHQVVLVSFSDLIADPLKVMRGIGDRMGLTWDAILTFPTFNGMPVASNSSFASEVGIDPSVIGRGDTLPAQVREQIERDDLPLFQRFVETADV